MNLDPDPWASIRRRLSQLALWIGHKGRPPGLLGSAVRISGFSRDGSPAALVRHGDTWSYEKNGQNPIAVSDTQALLGIVPNDAFDATEVIVVPDVAPLLFHGAVEAAEASVHQCNVALAIALKGHPDARELVSQDLAQGLTFPLPDPVSFALGNGALDKAVRQSIASIALAVATLDAQLNVWANEKGGFSKSEQHRPLTTKFTDVAHKFGKSLDADAEPYSTLRALIAARNALIHAKGQEQSFPLGPTGAGRDLSVQARATCHSVRSALVALAILIGRPKPAYLAYCPAADPADDEAWRGAVVGMGMRDDPDYPPLSAGP